MFHEADALPAGDAALGRESIQPSCGEERIVDVVAFAVEAQVWERRVGVGDTAGAKAVLEGAGPWEGGGRIEVEG